MMPAIDVLEGELEESLLNAVSSDSGIEYGGVDDEGDPAIRDLFNAFES